MNSFEREALQNPFSQERFHFKEIAEIEPAMLSLVGQLKEKLEAGEYNTLISDDTGGRIPTLIIKDIMKKMRPDVDVRTYFIASGQTYLPSSEREEDYSKLNRHLTKIAANTHKALLVTQFIFTGDTLVRLLDAAHHAGIHDVDIASVEAMPRFTQEAVLRQKLKNNSLYIGSDAHFAFSEKHTAMSGVTKSKEYSPVPIRTIDAMARDGRKISAAEWREIFGIETDDTGDVILQKYENPAAKAEFERRVNAPLTTEEKGSVQRNIVAARQDAHLLADRITRQVWNRS